MKGKSGTQAGTEYFYIPYKNVLTNFFFAAFVDTLIAYIQEK